MTVSAVCPFGPIDINVESTTAGDSDGRDVATYNASLPDASRSTPTPQP